MEGIKDLYQSADWKKEKHMPVIEVEPVKAGGMVGVSVSVGKEIAHPNTTGHHIRWIDVYFKPEGEKFPCQIGKFDFSAHGESVNGLDTGTVYTEPRVAFAFKTAKPGTIVAAVFCNIHGLWENRLILTEIP